MSEQKINIREDSMPFNNAVTDNLTKPNQTSDNTADSVLRLAANVVGLPADYISYYLETFRTKYIENYQTIVDENKCYPDFRISCTVLRNAGYSAEEPEIQTLFASLLASASDKELLDKVHPGFASIINQMTLFDFKVLIDFHMGITKSTEISTEFNDQEEQLISQAESNLIRLGLLQRVEYEYNQQEINNFIGKQKFNEMSIIKELIASNNPPQLAITQFGKNFVSVVYK